MRSFLPIAMLLCALALAAGGCKSDSAPEPTPDPTPSPSPKSPEDILDASVAALESARSFTVQVTITAPTGDDTTRVESLAAYERREMVYSTYSVRYSGSDVAQQEYLLLFPDLYIRQGTQWYVQSPWNQGVKASELPDPEDEDPINLYQEMIDEADDIEARSTTTVGGVELHHIVGDLGYGTDLDVWIRVDNNRPTRVEINEADPAPWDNVPGGSTVIEFDSFDETAELPDAPTNVRPIRDLELPVAPCTGDGFEACTVAQTELRSDDTAACENGTERRICVMPLGRIDPAIVTEMANYFRAEYGLTVLVLPPREVPPEMADSLREQVDSRELISFMEHQLANANDPNMVLIGLTPIDVYDSQSTYRYVFGLRGDASDPKAVISTFRMDPTTYGETPDAHLTLERTRKLFSKYVGLLYYDLPVSDDPHSVMFNSILGPDDLDAMTEPLQVPED